MTPERRTANIIETVKTLRREIALHAPAAAKAAANLPATDPKTVDALLDVLVAHAPTIADEWRLSEFDATNDLEMTADQVGQSLSLMAAIDHAFERAAKDGRDIGAR